MPALLLLLSCIRLQRSSCTQKYTKILDKCRASGAHFVDDEFPASDRSCFYSKHPSSGRPIVWKRISDLCENPCLFGDGASADDIMQGSLGDCWFL
jgi:Calpain family cysteine protease